MNEITTIVMIERTAGKNDKVQLMVDNKSDKLLQLLDSAYNPYRVYGIKALDFTESTEVVYRESLHMEFIYLLGMLMHNNINDKIRGIVVKFLERCPKPQQEIYYRIIIKDLTIGITLKSVNKAFPGFIPEYKIMKAAPYTTQDLDKPMIVQPKFDGYRTTIVKEGAAINCYTSSGKIIPLKEIEKELLKIEGNFVLDGELVTTSRTGTSTVCNRLIKGNTEVDSSVLRFHAFDLINFTEFKTGKFVQPCDDRLLMLEVFGINNSLKYVLVTNSYITKSTEEVMKLYKDARDREEEGIMVKAPKAPYSGKRSEAWLKLKAINSCTLKIIGKIEHNKVPNTLGAFICIDGDGITKTNVGGGFSDEDREVFWKANMEGKCIEALYNEVQFTKDGTPFLFLPRFKEVRPEKSEADRFQKILDEER